MKKTQTIEWKPLSPKHKRYIKNALKCKMSVAEGAIRSGKTIDHCIIAAMRLEVCRDKIHLASGSTIANAKMNIGDCNGFGLEHLFRGRCRWGNYKNNDALYIQTQTGEKIVIFAGGGKADSYKRILGNSYGIWIATEVNEHFDSEDSRISFIKVAFGRQVAALDPCVLWDMNPCHPGHKIYTDYLDVYPETYVGGYNYEHFTIADNYSISPQRRREIESQYAVGSIWYIRDILGQRAIAEGLCYPMLATSIAAKNGNYTKPKAEVQKLIKDNRIAHINVGVDFGGNGSGHAFVASAATVGYEQLIILRSERYVEGKKDPYTGRNLSDIDPETLNKIFIRFLRTILRDYGFISKIYCDSAEQVLIRGFRNALIREHMGNIRVNNALKSQITDRIFAVTALAAQGRFFYTEDCGTYCEAVSMAVWDSKQLELIRLDDGSSDIDSLDASEYSFERDIKKFIKM